MSQELVDALRSPRCYAHETGTPQLLETHISWVLLTGRFAYKIKKPVNFGFLDFSTLEQRHFYCQEELRLNSRFSEDLYLEVVPITGTIDRPEMGGEGEALDYAVKMRQFDQSGLLDRLVERRALADRDIRALGRQLADFHGRLAAPLPEGEDKLGSVEAISGSCLENFRQIEPLLQDDEAVSQLQELRQWTEAGLRRLTPVFERRRREGHVKECHGDLHLGNIARIEGDIVFFDCIEFNPALRWIDTQSELAFLLMDMEEKQLRREANILLNTYLEYSGDYGGLALLDFYRVYRAMVRAKVELLRVAGGGLNREEAQACRKEYRRYIRLARGYLRPRRSFLAIMHGVSGTGKSTVAATLAAELDMVRLRSDVERKRLFGLAPRQRGRPNQQEEMYSRATSDRVFSCLAALADSVLGAGFAVVADATFIEARRREPFLELSRALGVPFVILDCHASEQALEARLGKRAAGGESTSDADLEVMRRQLPEVQPFTARERDCVLRIDTEKAVTAAPLQAYLEDACTP